MFTNSSNFKTAQEEAKEQTTEQKQLCQRLIYINLYSEHLEKQLEIEEIRAKKNSPKQHFLTKALIFDKVDHLF